MKRIIAFFLAIALIASSAWATNKKSLANIGAADSYVQPIYVQGVFNLSISGTWAGTVTLQRSFDNGATWLDVSGYTGNAESNSEYEPEGGVCYRAGFKAGQYTSGTAVIRISQ